MVIHTDTHTQTETDPGESTVLSGEVFNVNVVEVFLCDDLKGESLFEAV